MDMMLARLQTFVLPPMPLAPPIIDAEMNDAQPVPSRTARPDASTAPATPIPARQIAQGQHAALTSPPPSSAKSFFDPESSEQESPEESEGMLARNDQAVPWQTRVKGQTRRVPTPMVKAPVSPRWVMPPLPLRMMSGASSPAKHEYDTLAERPEHAQPRYHDIDLHESERDEDVFSISDLESRRKSTRTSPHAGAFASSTGCSRDSHSGSPAQPSASSAGRSPRKQTQKPITAGMIKPKSPDMARASEDSPRDKMVTAQQTPTPAYTRATSLSFKAHRAELEGGKPLSNSKTQIPAVPDLPLARSQKQPAPPPKASELSRKATIAASGDRQAPGHSVVPELLDTNRLAEAQFDIHNAPQSLGSQPAEYSLSAQLSTAQQSIFTPVGMANAQHDLKCHAAPMHPLAPDRATTGSDHDLDSVYSAELAGDEDEDDELAYYKQAWAGNHAIITDEIVAMPPLAAAVVQASLSKSRLAEYIDRPEDDARSLSAARPSSDACGPEPRPWTVMETSPPHPPPLTGLLAKADQSEMAQQYISGRDQSQRDMPEEGSFKQSSPRRPDRPHPDVDEYIAHRQSIFDPRMVNHPGDGLPFAYPPHSSSPRSTSSALPQTLHFDLPIPSDESAEKLQMGPEPMKQNVSKHVAMAPLPIHIDTSDYSPPSEYTPYPFRETSATAAARSLVNAGQAMANGPDKAGSPRVAERVVASNSPMAASVNDPGRHTSITDIATMPLSTEREVSLTIFVRRRQAPRRRLEAQVIIPASTKEAQSLDGVGKGAFDDRALFALLRRRYHADLLGQRWTHRTWRRWLSARTLTGITITPLCAGEQQTDAMERRDEAINAELWRAFARRKPAAQSTKWVQLARRLASVDPIRHSKTSASSPSTQSPLVLTAASSMPIEEQAPRGPTSTGPAAHGIEFIEQWSLFRIQCAFYAVLIIAAAACVLWVMLGPDLVPDTARASSAAARVALAREDRVGAGIGLAIAVLFVGWVSVGAWLGLSWLVM